MPDHLVIATAAGDTVRIYAALTTEIVATASRIHETWPTATAALGRLLTGALITGTMSDNLYRLTLEISGSGPIGKILAVSNRRGIVKGYVENPQVDLDLNQAGKLDVGSAVGEGYLAILKDHGLKEPYRGIVPLQNGEIATDLAYYFVKSEQTPSAVALGVLVAPDGRVEAAGGLIVQLMPGATTTTLTALEEKLAKLPSITSMLNDGMNPRQLVKEVFNTDPDLKYLAEEELFYQCDCSREKFRGPLLSLGRRELDEIVREQGRVEVKCHFCNKVYTYPNADLE